MKKLLIILMDAASKTNVLLKKCHTLGMDGTQVCVFTSRNKVGFRSLLCCKKRSRLETDFILDVTGDLADEALEGYLPDEGVD